MQTNEQTKDARIAELTNMLAESENYTAQLEQVISSIGAEWNFLKADSERLEWLATNDCYVQEFVGGWCLARINGFMYETMAPTFREAIDIARAAQEGE